MVNIILQDLSQLLFLLYIIHNKITSIIIKNYVKNIESKLIDNKNWKKKKFCLITKLLPYFLQPVTHFFPLSQIRLNNCFGIMLKIDDVVEENGKKRNTMQLYY